MTKKLRAIVDDLSSVPVRLIDSYEKGEDGRYYLQVEPVDGLSLGAVEAAKADADRYFDKLASKIRSDVIGDALKRVGGDPLLLEPHLTANVQVDRQTLVTRVIGSDGKFASVDAILADLKARPGFACAFDNPGASDGASAEPGNFTDQMRAERLRRETDAKKAASAMPRPVLSPRAPGYNMSAAAAWAKGDPARTAELLAACAGGRS